MEINTEYLCRQLSDSSREIIETISSNEGSDIIIYALNAIKVAHISNRINDAEKAILKSFIKDRNMSVSSDLLEKLTEGERACILSLNKTNRTEPFIEADYIRLKRRYRDEDKNLSLLLETALTLVPSTPSLATTVSSTVDLNQQIESCCVCGEDKHISQGIKCSRGHFFCNDCLTAWVSAINDERENDPEKFRSRRGMITCPHAMTDRGGSVLPCTSGNYSHANVCRHITDEDILGKYIEGLKHIQALQLYADYQLQVLTEMENLKSEFKIENVEIDPNGNTLQNLRQFQASRAEFIKRHQKRIELKNLASTLKKLHPDARQCRKCNWGPILKVKCDDLLLHHKKQASASSDVIFDNSCPGCGCDPPADWKMLPNWNGKLPNSYLQEECGLDVVQQIDSNGGFKWAEFLIEFTHVSDYVANSIDMNIRKVYADVDAMYLLKKQDNDVEVLVADLVATDQRLEIVAFKLNTSLDLLFKLMDSHELKSSSLIKSLIKRKQAILSLISYDGNEDVLEWLNKVIGDLKSIMMHQTSSLFENYDKCIFVKDVETTSDQLIKIETLTDIGDDPEVLNLLRRERDFLLSKAYIPLNKVSDIESVMIEDIFYFKHKLNVSLSSVSLVTPSIMNDSPFIQIQKDEMKSILATLDNELATTDHDDGSHEFQKASLTYTDADDGREEIDSIKPVDYDKSNASWNDIEERLHAVFPLSVGLERSKRLINFSKSKSEFVEETNCLFSFTAHRNYIDSYDNIGGIYFRDVEVAQKNVVEHRYTLDVSRPLISSIMKNAQDNFFFRPFQDFQLHDNMIPFLTSEILSSIEGRTSVDDLLPEDFCLLGYRAGVYILSNDCMPLLRKFISDKIKDITSIARIDIGIKFEDPKKGVKIESTTKDQLKHSKKDTILSKDVERALRETSLGLPKVVLGHGIRGMRHIFGEWIQRVLRQVHPNISISVKAQIQLNDMLTWMLCTILEDFQRIIVSRGNGKMESNWITVQDLTHSLKIRFIGELARHGISEALKAAKKLELNSQYDMYDIDENGDIVLNKKEEKIGFLTVMANLQFEVRPIHYIIKQLYPDIKLSLTALVAFSASIEYLSAELLELSGNSCRDRNCDLICPRDLYFAVTRDTELHDSFNCVIFSDVGTSTSVMTLDEIFGINFDFCTSTFDLLFSTVQSDTKMLMIDPRDGVLKDSKSEQAAENFVNDNLAKVFMKYSKIPQLFERLSSHSRERLKFIANKNLSEDLKATIGSFDEIGLNLYSHVKRIRSLIVRQQDQTDYCISFATWRSLINEYKDDGDGDACNLTEESYRMIATYIENQLTTLLCDAKNIAIRGKRLIVTKDDISLVQHTILNNKII